MTDQVPESEDTGFLPQGEATYWKKRPRVVTLDEDMWNHFIERLDAVKGGLHDLWLALAGIAGGAGFGAVIARYSLPKATIDTDDIGTKLWIIAIAAFVVAGLCVAAYFSMRNRRGEDIGTITKGMRIHQHPDSIPKVAPKYRRGVLQFCWETVVIRRRPTLDNGDAEQ